MSSKRNLTEFQRRALMRRHRLAQSVIREVDDRWELLAFVVAPSKPIYDRMLDDEREAHRASVSAGPGATGYLPAERPLGPPPKLPGTILRVRQPT